MSWFIALLALNVLLVSLVVIPYLKLQVWWVRGFDFPRLQSFVFGLTLLLVEIVVVDLTTLQGWVLISITCMFIVVQGWWVLPYSPLIKPEVKLATASQNEAQISLLNANVFTPNRNAQALLDLINHYQPDIVVTLESDQWWQDQLTTIEKDYPYSLKCPLDNLYGMHVYSKIKFIQRQLAFLVEDDVPSMHFLFQLGSATDVRLHVLHPAPPSPTENKTSVERDGELLQIAKYCQKQQKQNDVPVIVAGDLNDVAWSRSTRLFRKMSGLLDPRVGRGMFNTFHAKYWPVRWPLDHIFHSAHFRLVKMERLAKIGSDHFPIYVQLAYQPAKEEEQQGLTADSEDKALAEEKLNKVDSA